MDLRTAQVSAKAERRAIVALFALFALLVQAALPGFAMAREAANPGLMVICSSPVAKAQAANDGAPAKSAPAHGCDHCVCPHFAAPPATPTQVAEPVRYVAAAPRLLLRAEDPKPGQGLAAPPPPPRGPPARLI